MRRLKQLFSRNTNKKEDGNSLIFFLMLFPVTFSVFGLAIDWSIAGHISGSVQSSISTATQTTLSQAANPINSDRPMLTEDEAYDIVTTLYARNTGRTGGDKGADRAGIPFLMCQKIAEPGGKLKTAPNVSPCAWTEKDNGFMFSNADRNLSVEYSVIEISDTAFLQFLGIDTLTYRITGKATTSFSGTTGGEGVANEGP